MRAASLLLVAALAAADFLSSYHGTRDTWVKYFDLQANTMVYVADVGDFWPLDMPPWEFIDYVVSNACTDPHACWFRSLQVPATLALAYDRKPVRANISVTIEGIFRNTRDCCTRDDLIKMMALLLQEMYQPKHTQYLQYETYNPLTNQTDVVHQPIYALPKAVGVARGYRVFKARNFLNVMVESHTTRRTPRRTCSLLTPEARRNFRTRIRPISKTRRRLGSVSCLWYDRGMEPPLPLSYESPADRILRGFKKPLDSEMVIDFYPN